MDTFRCLRTAHVVAAEGSFSAAARRLGVTPAAVTKAIAQLEAHLGLRLFDRSTRHLALTVEGRALLARTEGPMQAVADALASHDGADGDSTLKVSVAAPFARLAVLPALPEFLAAQPGLRVDLRLENRRVDLLREGYDCAIGVQPADDSSLVARPLVTVRAVLCAAPAYLGTHGTPSTIADLAAHRCIALRSESTGRLRDWTFVVRGRGTVFVPPPTLQVTDPEVAAAAAAAGCGIAFVGLHHAAEAIAAGRLVRVLPALPGPRLVISVYWAQRRLLPPRTRAFVDHLVRTVPRMSSLVAARQGA